MKILIGSRALSKYIQVDRVNENTDWDYITDGEVLKGTDHHVIPDFFNFLTKEEIENEVASLKTLYTIKLSHLLWDINWYKHFMDVQIMGGYTTCDYKLLNFLIEYHTSVHGKKIESNLDMTSEEFFDNAVNCKYDHDLLHTFIKEVPTYKQILADEQEVLVSESKFNKLDFWQKASLIHEEVAVMGFERYSTNIALDYYTMLHKFITRHAPIWEATWFVKNITSFFFEGEYRKRIEQIKEGIEKYAEKLYKFGTLVKEERIANSPQMYCIVQYKNVYYRIDGYLSRHEFIPYDFKEVKPKTKQIIEYVTSK